MIKKNKELEIEANNMMQSSMDKQTNKNISEKLRLEKEKADIEHVFFFFTFIIQYLVL